MQTFKLGALSAIGGPVRPNSDVGGLHHLPAVSTDDSGMLNAPWFKRNGPSTTLTDLKGVLGLSPLITSTPTANITVTDVASDWNADTSAIVPNFGDYTDSHLIALNQAPYVGKQLFVAWSDGRLGEPQPFEANLTTHPQLLEGPGGCCTGEAEDNRGGPFDGQPKLADGFVSKTAATGAGAASGRDRPRPGRLSPRNLGGC